MQDSDALSGTINLGRSFKREWRELVIKLLLFMCALVTIATTVSIIVVLVRQSAGFFDYVGVGEFLFGTNWNPRDDAWGVLPLFAGTMLVMLGSALIALPLGLAAAIYLSEFASHKTRSMIKPALEVLAGIPTVVYGFFALTVITPALREVFGEDSVAQFNAASAMVVVGIMVLPMVASLCDEALRAVPTAMRQAGYAVGATKFEVTTQVVVPAALSGILASFVLAMSRAIGETMAVAIAAGITPNLTVNPFESIQTMTSYIVEAAKTETERMGAHAYSMFAVASLLFVITFVMNVISNRILNRFQETYE